MVEITLNGRKVDADPKKPLIAACHGEGADVPMYCYHPGLSPVGSCRICQVEVQQGEMPARVMVACRTPVTEGMVVNTEAPLALETRRECLEFLLKNHPLDCPICDKAGECDLQDYAFEFGQAEGRSQEPRRQLEKRKSLGEVILLDQERCILCSRCVRFTEEVSKTHELAVVGLGSRSVISTFADRPLTGNYQGNLADICPVGALTLKEFRFEARVWNLRKTPSTCAECSRGCAISAEVLRGGEIKRFRPRPDGAVNGFWMCDQGRFALELPNDPERSPGALRRGDRDLEPVSVDRALDQASDLLRLPGETLFLLSPFMTCEEVDRALDLSASLGVQARFLSPPPNGLADELLHTGDPCPNRRGLEDRGVEGIDPEIAREHISAATTLLLCGERILDGLGGEPVLARLDPAVRLIVLDASPLDVPALDVQVGVPRHLEKSGTWRNVDGFERRLYLAKAPPTGVQPLTRTLRHLSNRIEHRGVATARPSVGVLR